MRIDLLMVPNCAHDDAAAALIAAALADTGVRAIVTRTIITSPEQARERGFVGSPTILLDGSDPFAAPGAPVALACRLYPTPDGPRGVPTLGDLCDALEEAGTPVA